MIGAGKWRLANRSMRCCCNSPFEMCPNITPNYKALIGIQMGPGWRKAIRMKVGGVQGCTHLTELLFPMATVAMQTIWPLSRKKKNNKAKEERTKNISAPNHIRHLSRMGFGFAGGKGKFA